MELSTTAHVILGMLAWRPMSGYDVKALVDRSVRFFWAVSYGQIYPELRRLSEAGLIDAADEPQGGRRRTVYTLTEAGRGALEEWLAQAPETFATRDQGLAQQFFPRAPAGAARGALGAQR